MKSKIWILLKNEYWKKLNHSDVISYENSVVIKGSVAHMAKHINKQQPTSLFLSFVKKKNWKNGLVVFLQPQIYNF